MEYLQVSPREIEILETAILNEVNRIRKHPKAHEKEWAKYQAETQQLLNKVGLKKIKLGMGNE